MFNCVRISFTLSKFQQNYIRNSYVETFSVLETAVLRLETAIKQTEYFSSYFEKIHSLFFFKMSDCFLRQLVWLLCLPLHKLVFSEKRDSKKGFMMFTLQATTEDIPKKQSFREIPQSKRVQLNLWSKYRCLSQFLVRLQD